MINIIWLASPDQGRNHFLIVFGAHMDIVVIIKVKNLSEAHGMVI